MKKGGIKKNSLSHGREEAALGSFGQYVTVIKGLLE